MSVLGIDVASFQPVDYPTNGLGFAFVKATENVTYTNPKYGAQVARARAAGLTVGHYHFLWPGNIAAQAQYFVQHADIRAGDILACDWESTENETHATGAEKDAFIKAVQALRPNNRVVLYCNTSDWKNRDTTSFCGDGLWIADPNHPAGKPGITHGWAFQQYSSAGGIDRNIANFSSAAALRAWAAGTEPNVTTHDPLNSADIASIWKTDGIVPAPAPPVEASDYATNKTWTAANSLAAATQAAREANANTAALLKQSAALSNSLSDMQKQVTALGDPDAFADQVLARITAGLSGLGITLTVQQEPQP